MNGLLRIKWLPFKRFPVFNHFFYGRQGQFLQPQKPLAIPTRRIIWIIVPLQLFRASFGRLLIVTTLKENSMRQKLVIFSSLLILPSLMLYIKYSPNSEHSTLKINQSLPNRNGNEVLFLFTYIFKDVPKVFFRSLIFGLSLVNPTRGWKSVIAFTLKKNKVWIITLLAH